MKIGVEEASRILAGANDVLLVGHTDPDGDCLGSLYALAKALKSDGKNALAVIKKPLPAKHRYLADLLTPETKIPPKADLIIVLDTARTARQDFAPAELPEAPTLCIDHHLGDHEEYGNSFYDEKCAACAILVYRVIRELGIEIDNKIADALYTGIVTDTNSFTNQNTTEEAFQVATELVRLGADPGKIAAYVYGSLTLNDLAALSKSLASLELYYNDTIAILTLKKEWTGGRHIDTELFVNYARNLITTELAVMIIETDTGVRINLRSKGGFDARAVAVELGGGGHKAAAGIRMQATIEEAKAALLKVISEKI